VARTKTATHANARLASDQEPEGSVDEPGPHSSVAVGESGSSRRDRGHEIKGDDNECAQHDERCWHVSGSRKTPMSRWLTPTASDLSNLVFCKEIVRGPQ